MDTAKLLINGKSQAVILPEEFSFEGEEVYIKKIGNAVILISKDNPWQPLFDSLDQFSKDFMVNREQSQIENRGEIVSDQY